MKGQDDLMMTAGKRPHTRSRYWCHGDDDLDQERANVHQGCTKDAAGVVSSAGILRTQFVGAVCLLVMICPWAHNLIPGCSW